jgi:hypothetical protein
VVACSCHLRTTVLTSTTEFADVLEQLETQFYQQAIQKFNASASSVGFADPNLLLQQLTAIQSDEATHASVLESSLGSFGQTPLGPQCKFDFGPILQDLSGTLGAARLVENLGVAAYIGAAHIVNDPDLLSAAASIATVEARHQTVLNVLSGGGSVIPQSFDIALLPNEVLATAAQFITSGCDTGIKPNALLTTSPAAPQPGDKLTFNSTAFSGDMSGMSCQIMSGNLQNSLNATVMDATNCTIPADINGPIAVFITSDNTALPNDPVARNLLNNTVAGPAMMFVDAISQLLPTMVRQTGTTVGTAATTTQTVSPSQAQGIINGSSSSSNTPTADVAVADASCSGCDSQSDTPGGMNMFTGPTKVGGVTVMGFTSGPSDGSSGASSSGAPSSDASSTDSSAASSTDSSSASATDSASASSTDSAAASSSTS